MIGGAYCPLFHNLTSLKKRWYSSIDPKAGGKHMPGVYSISVSSNPTRRSQDQAPGTSAKSISFQMHCFHKAYANFRRGVVKGVIEKPYTHYYVQYHFVL